MSDIAKPLITTIIPTYRRPKLLRRAIKSVLNQTYPHFQVCVYDNASGDETASVVDEIAKEYPCVKYHCHPENIGALANFNYGMKHVETPFFSFFSDDDILLPEFYQTAMEGFEKHPEAIFSSTLTLDSDNQCNIWDSFGFNWIPGFYQPPEGLLVILKNGHPTWTGILFRREVIERVGMLDSEVGAGADLDFELRTAAHFPFVISLKPGAIFASHPLSSCRQGGFSHIWPGRLKMIRNLTEDERIPSDVRAYAARVLTERIKKGLYSIGCRSILRKNFEDVHKVSEVLRNYYRLSVKASFLYTIAKVCNYFPVIYNFGTFLNKIRKFFLIKKLQYLQKRNISPSILMYVKKLENE